MVIRIILSIFRSFNLNFVHEMMLVIAASALVRDKWLVKVRKSLLLKSVGVCRMTMQPINQEGIIIT